MGQHAAKLKNGETAEYVQKVYQIVCDITIGKGHSVLGEGHQFDNDGGGEGSKAFSGPCWLQR